MALVTLEEAKEYLRVSTSDEDALISSFILTADVLVKNVGRVPDEKWEAVNANPDPEDPADIVEIRSVCKAGEFYAMAYLFEHREEADHHDLTITLRNLLFSVREGVV